MARPLGEIFSHQQSNLETITNPRDSEGFLFDEVEARAAQQTAYEALPYYEVGLAGGLDELKEPETTESGASIHQELATFIDMTGKLVKREVTIGVPNPGLGDDQVSPFAIVSADSWTTGPSGLNRYKTKRYLELGYPVVWIHHAGRHSPVHFDKSISHAAHQDHVLLDYISDSVGFDTSTVIGDGYSRGAMIREKFIAIAADYGRSVPYSDLEAPCFARDMGRAEKVATLLRQLPSEALGIGRVALKVVERAIEDNDPKLLIEYMGTPDFHPRNIGHEGLWPRALINSKVADYIAATPVDTEGIRTFFSKDIMSQRTSYEDVYRQRRNLHVIVEKGPHVEGATPQYIDKKIQRLADIMTWMQANGMTLDGFKADEVLQPPDKLPRIHRRKRHLGLIA